MPIKNNGQLTAFLYGESGEIIDVSDADISEKVESVDIQPCQYFASESIVVNIGDKIDGLENIKTQLDYSNPWTISYVTIVQARKHRKKRINKKWLKRYGYKKVMKITYGWKMIAHTDGVIEFVKEII